VATQGWLQLAMRVRDLEVKMAAGEPSSRIVRAYREALRELFEACRDRLAAFSPGPEPKVAGYAPEEWRTGA
jgi:hypothetical protein